MLAALACTWRVQAVCPTGKGGYLSAKEVSGNNQGSVLSVVLVNLRLDHLGDGTLSAADDKPGSSGC